MKKQTKKWTFRVLFSIFLVYHIWSYVSFGLAGGTGAFSLIGVSEFQTRTVQVQTLEVLFVIVVNLINWFIQAVLPIMFFYYGWIKK